MSHSAALPSSCNEEIGSNLHLLSFSYVLDYKSVESSMHLTYLNDEIASILAGEGDSFISEVLSEAERRSAYEEEKQKWITANAMRIVNEPDLPADSNVIGSYV